MSTNEVKLDFEFDNLAADPELLRRFTIGTFAGDVVFHNEGTLGILENGANIRRYEGVDADGKIIATNIGRFTMSSAGEVIATMKDKTALIEMILLATDFEVLSGTKNSS
jgi:hypothetical protein